MGGFVGGGDVGVAAVGVRRRRLRNAEDMLVVFVGVVRVVGDANLS